MTKTLCDRCGADMPARTIRPDPYEGLRSMASLQAAQTYQVHTGYLVDKDLCPTCVRELQEWFEDKK